VPGTKGAWHQTFGPDLQARPLAADDWRMTRSVIGLCSMIGLFVGGYLPMLWGASTLGVESLLLGALGGLAGVWAGAKLSDF
jgi:hypothetical protein